MAIRSHSWYNKNSTRRYPFDANATGETDTGQNFPDDILVDCHIRFPDDIGDAIVLSSAYVSDKLVSLTFAVTTTKEVDSSLISSMSWPLPVARLPFTPIAVISLLRTGLVVGQQYPVESQKEGVGGWVVFGKLIEGNEFNGSFTTSAQSLIAERCARPYKKLPVSSVGKLGLASSLKDIVTLQGLTDIEIVKDTRSIDGYTRDAIIFSLISNTDTRNLLQEYSGPCAGRPESETCLKPGIERVNTVVPDCDGNINIVYNDCINPGEATATGIGYAGQVLDFCMPLTCMNTAIPQYIGDCFGNVVPSTVTTTVHPTTIAGRGAGDWGGTDYTNTAEAGPAEFTPPFYSQGILHYMAVRHGTWSVEHPNPNLNSSLSSSAFFGATDAANLNLATFDNNVYTHCRNKIWEVEGQLREMIGESNFGSVFGYRKVDTNFRFFVAELNKTKDAFRVMYYNNSFYSVLMGSTGVTAQTEDPLGLLYNKDYKIVVSTKDNTVDASLDAGITQCTVSLFQGISQIYSVVFTTTLLHVDSRLGVYSRDSLSAIEAIYYNEIS